MAWILCWDVRGGFDTVSSCFFSSGATNELNISLRGVPFTCMHIFIRVIQLADSVFVFWQNYVILRRCPVISGHFGTFCAEYVSAASFFQASQRKSCQRHRRSCTVSFRESPPKPAVFFYERVMACSDEEWDCENKNTYMTLAGTFGLRSVVFTITYIKRWNYHMCPPPFDFTFPKLYGMYNVCCLQYRP